MPKLLVVESPNKAKKIAEYLGPTWKVVASFGHIWDLPEREIGVSPPDFRPKYVPVNDGKAIRGIKSAASGLAPDDIYIGTDIDREGEAIAAHVALVLGISKPKRVRFTAIEPAALKAAVAKPDTIDTRRVNAQEARRVLDRLIGYTVSPKATNLVSLKLSAGRVQSPAVRLVVDRERAIKNFTPVKFFDVVLTMNTEGVEWYATWIFEPFLADDEEYITDQALVQDVAKTSPVKVTQSATERALRNPPPAFTTSSLQQAASVALKMSPERTMDAAQALFEAGHITYHRTDDPNLSPEAAASIRTWLTQNGFAVPAKPHRWRSKANAQEAHGAIAPTRVELQQLDLANKDQTTLYELIWRRAVASQMKPAELDVTTTTLEGTSPQGREVAFKARGFVIVAKEWMALLNGQVEADEDEDGDGGTLLPVVRRGTSLKPEKGETLAKSTRPPSRFTEASLIKALEDMGIGRPSTFASIMKVIKGRDYVTINKKRQVLPTDLGMLLVDLLKPMKFMDYQFTQGLETYLDRIAAGEAQYQPLMANLHALLMDELARLSAPPPSAIPESLRAQISSKPTETYPCPVCGKGQLHRRKAGGKGGFFWGCDQYNREDPAKGCKHTAPDVNGKPGVRQPIPKKEGATT